MNDTIALAIARKLSKRFAQIDIGGPPGFRTVRATLETGPVTRRIGRRLGTTRGITEETPMPKRRR